MENGEGQACFNHLTNNRPGKKVGVGTHFWKFFSFLFGILICVALASLFHFNKTLVFIINTLKLRWL